MTHKRTNGGFFIIYGWRRFIRAEGGIADCLCPSCGKRTQFHGKVGRTFATLFFIPFFPIGAPERFCQCNACGAQFHVAIEQIQSDLQRQSTASNEQMASNSDSLQSHGNGGSVDRSGVRYKAAVAMLQEMSQSPEDDEKMLQVLQMFMAIDAPADAISAAANYPLASEQSDACLAILALAHMKLAQTAEAIECAEGSLEINPENAFASSLLRSLETNNPASPPSP